MTKEAAQISATLLLFAAMIVPLMTRGWPLWARAAWQLAAFIALTYLVLRTVGSPFGPEFDTVQPGARIWQQLIGVGWWLIAAQCAIGIVRLFVVFEAKPRETRIVSDLMAGIIHLLTLFAVINFVFAVPVGGLLATSGVIAIVLGLALQSSLSDVFSGIAVGIERPYSPGDLVWVEGGIEGRVIQVNWRSTHIATPNGDVAIVPNSVMAKARLVNHSMPTNIRRVSITVKLAANELPDRCMAVLNAAVKTCMLLSATPPPSVARTGLEGDGVAYDISFSIPSIEVLVAARTELLGHVQSHLRHAGIALAVPGVPIRARLDVPSAATLLQESDWFGVLAESDRILLAEHLVEVWFAAGDKLMKQGDDPKVLFILASGTVEISNDTPEWPEVIFRLGPGSSLGAIGMITGTPYAATATALTPVTAYSLDKQGVGDAIAVRPDLVKSFEVLARRGQEMNRRDVVARQSDDAEAPEMFLSKLRSFLRKISETPRSEGQRRRR
ncbi:mechanosensitive ion channel family protein [Rhizobium sp. T1470]|uniref:mechanosensitive ion channel family protein n=1 Tax=unclassified Rhizobium TaxID=2613769 RepID=UPI001AAE4F14|nr:mechanosensitive ion channel family protein [Rhizobium sp. T1473]MCA0802785.1 mechanosensitive ion channel family protein [Rhizobium sp. T1473]